MDRMRSCCSSCGMVSAGGQRVAAALQIVGIHDQRFRQFSRRARELAEHQHALQIRTRGHEFLGHQVHAVVQAAYVAKIRGAIEAEHFRRLMMGSKQDDGPVVLGSEALIDARRQLLHRFVEFPVSLDLGPAGRRQLRES